MVKGEFYVYHEVTGGDGVDVVIEMLANVNLDTDTTLLRKYGTVVVSSSLIT